jgi:Fe2+ transport system protein B
MNELLESLDASIFTPELKEAINAHFEVAVKDMNEAFINEKTAELEVEYTNKIEEKIQELEEKAEEYMAGLEKGISEKEADLEAKIAEYDAKIVETEAKAEEHKTFLDEKAEEYISSKLEEMLGNVDKYLDRIVEEFVDEASDKLDESLKSEKADMIIEAFDAMLIATGVEVSKIVEAKEETEAESKLAESIEKYDTLVEENIELKSQNEKND